MLANSHSSRCLFLVMLLATGAAESTAAPAHPVSSSSFRFSVQDHASNVIGKCVASLIAVDWLITAAHCIPTSTSEIFAHCPGLDEQQGIRLTIIGTTRHPEVDLALVQITPPPDCTTKPLAISRLISDTDNFSSATVDVSSHNDHHFEFEVIQQDELTVILLDSMACLIRGDSGYPVLIKRDSEYLIAGVLINGTEGCPSFQSIVRLDKQADWIDSVIRRDQSNIDRSTPTCDVDSCLEVPHPGVVFCSIDPPGVGSLSALANKSTISFSSGLFSLHSGSGNGMPSITLHRATGTMKYSNDGPVKKTLIPALGALANGYSRLDVLTEYASPDDTIEVGFRVAVGIRPPIYRLEDNNAQSFMSRGLTMRVTSTNGTTLYSPCEFPGQAERLFQFELTGGPTIFATTQAITGSFELGYYLGHLLSARIELADSATEVSDRFNLAYLGSSVTQGDLNAPALVIRTEPSDHSCGYVFDSSQWDTEQAVDGYVAYSLNCDGTVGQQLPLASAIYPDDVVFP